jgi:predicted DNA binding CopG/RHH family protein
MSHKQSKASIKNHQKAILMMDLNKLLNNKFLGELPDIKEKLKNVLKDLDSIKFTDDNPKILSGEILDGNQIKELIVNATGYTKWKLDTTETLEPEDLDSIKKNFNVDFKENGIQKYLFSRNTNNRNALCTIIVTSLPGKIFEVALQTDRAGYGLDGLVNVKEFLGAVEMESDD